MNSNKIYIILKHNLRLIILLTLVLIKSGFDYTVKGQTQTFTSSGTFTVPSGVTSITIQAWGAGGGGSRVTSNSRRGGGGGGGAYASSVLTVVPGNMYSVVVGLGGSYNTDGGYSGFGNNLVRADGGNGGLNNSSTAGSGGSALNCIGTTTYSGGNGADGGSTYSGGGGGGAGSTGNGGNADGMNPGTGTSTNGGNGGTGVSKSVNGNNGLTYGGGGSGASANSSTDRNGGSGAGGLVIITWTVILPVENNTLDYLNGVHGRICSTAEEHQTATLTSPSGTLFSYINFASYGTPDGTCPDFTIGSCNATNSRTVIESFLLGNNTADIPDENSVFGDPCVGTFKRLYITATYTEPVCYGSAPGTITGSLPTGGNGIFTYLWESSTTHFSSGFSAASGTNNTQNYTPPALTHTTWFRRKVTSGGMTSISPVFMITVNPVSEITWLGSSDTNWNNALNWCGGIPASSSSVVIPGRLNQPVISTEAACNNITISPGAVLTIASTGKLVVNGSINNQAGVSGLILKSDASGDAALIHNTNNVNATVERYIAGSAEEWHFISSPVSNQLISANWLPSGTYGNGSGYDLYVWDEVSSCWVYQLNTTNIINWNNVHPQANFVPGKGYLYAVQELNPTKQFTGNLNNGMVTIPVTSLGTDLTLKGINLIGNPYPSSIDWQASAGWDRSILYISGSGYDMWIWNPLANNYGVINSAGGTGTNGVTRYISSGQGFIVRAENSGDMAIGNSARNLNGMTGWLKKASGPGLQTFRAAVTSLEGNGFDEVQVSFGSEKESEGAIKIFSRVETAPSLFTKSDNEALTVRYLTDTITSPVVPLMFKAGKDGFFNIKVSFDWEEFATVILEDRKLNIMYDLRKNDTYKFNASVKDNESRFVVHFVKPLKNNTIASELEVDAFVSSGRLLIDMTKVTGMFSINVFDLNGRVIMRNDLQGEAMHEMDLNIRTQMLIVMINNPAFRVVRKIMWINE